jgi:hypothetical protein
MSCPLAGCGGKGKVIAKSEEVIAGLAVDASGVYWTTGTAGAVRACRDVVAGCGESAETVTTGITSPGAIGLDEHWIYFVARGSEPKTGALMKIAK